MYSLQGKKLADFPQQDISVLFSSFIICCPNLLPWKMYVFPVGWPAEKERDGK